MLRILRDHGFTHLCAWSHRVDPRLFEPLPDVELPDRGLAPGVVAKVSQKLHKLGA